MTINRRQLMTFETAQKLPQSTGIEFCIHTSVIMMAPRMSALYSSNNRHLQHELLSIIKKQHMRVLKNFKIR